MPNRALFRSLAPLVFDKFEDIPRPCMIRRKETPTLSVAGRVIFGVFNSQERIAREAYSDDIPAYVPAIELQGIDKLYPGDTLETETREYTIVNAEIDPAGALWTLHLRRPTYKKN
jgi:hypothetical protein